MCRCIFGCLCLNVGIVYNFYNNDSKFVKLTWLVVVEVILVVGPYVPFRLGSEFLVFSRCGYGVPEESSQSSRVLSGRTTPVLVDTGIDESSLSLSIAEHVEVSFRDA